MMRCHIYKLNSDVFQYFFTCSLENLKFIELWTDVQNVHYV